MGKIHLQDIDRLQEEFRPYQPIKTNRKKKLTPIYKKDNDQLDRN